MSQTRAQLLNPLNGNLNVTGVVTASSFVGNVTGDVNAGVVTASSISVSGNVSIGGTLTYEDVTNVDSIGLITARSGIQVLSGGINAVGVVTATSFVGSGENLTNLNIPAGFNELDAALFN